MPMDVNISDRESTFVTASAVRSRAALGKLKILLLWVLGPAALRRDLFVCGAGVTIAMAEIRDVFSEKNNSPDRSS